MKFLFIISNSDTAFWLSEVTHPLWHLAERGVAVEDFASPLRARLLFTTVTAMVPCFEHSTGSRQSRPQKASFQTPRRSLLVDRMRRLAPAPDGGDDFVGIGGPDEGLWHAIVPMKRLMAVWSSPTECKTLRFKRCLESLATSLHRIEPGAGSGCEWKVKRLWRVARPGPPGACGWRSCRARRGWTSPRTSAWTVSENRMNSSWLWRRIPADHLALEHVEGSKERCGAVAFVIVGHGSGASLLHRQAGLGTIRRLDLALLVDR